MSARTATDIHTAADAYRAGRLDEALAICRRMLKRAPRHVDALQLIGTISLQRGDDTEAGRCYRRCATLAPNEPHVHYLLGKLAAAQGRFADALPHYDKALTLRDGYEPAVSWKAYALDRLGRTDEALQLVEPYVAAGTADTVMLEVYAASCDALDRGDDAIDALRRAVSRPAVAPAERKVLLFRLGRVLDRAGDCDEAFAAFTAANRIGAPSFDRELWTRGVDELIACFSADRFATLARAGNTDERPVLVAGMPRSGTTLIEQIIDAHPDGRGAGELTDLAMTALQLPTVCGFDRPFPQCVLDLTRPVADRLAGRYLKTLDRRGGAARRIVDKSLLNPRVLGLAALLLPEARVIRCRRDQRDVCLSCFMSHLRTDTNPFASDLGDLAIACRQCERLMDHWATALPLPVLDVQYEKLVADPDAQIRRIIEFLDLPWDDRCLAFHDSGRAVNTLSYDQVRRPMYASAVGRWRRYGKHLSDLASLSESGAGAMPPIGPRAPTPPVG